MAKAYSYWIDSGKYSMLQKLFVMLFGVFSFMILARTWASQQALLGSWGLFLIISSIIETLRNALVKNGYILYIHTRHADLHPQVEYAALVINILFSVLFITFFLLSGSMLQTAFNAPGLASVLYYYCIALIVLIPYSNLEVYLISKTDFRSVFWMYFARNIVMFLSLAILYFSRQPITFLLLMIAYNLSLIAGLAAGMYTGKCSFTRPLQKHKKTFNEFIHFSKYVFVNNLFSLIFRSTDSFMTASFISAGVSAFYSTCARITNLVDMPSQVFADIMFPKAAKAVKQDGNEGLKRMYENTVAATLTFTLPAILVILLIPDLLLRIIAGPGYENAVSILQIMIFYGLFLPFIKQFGNAMDVMGKPKANSAVMTIFAIINIGLNFIGIKLFAINGSAIATLSSYVLLFVVTQIILGKELRISHKNIIANTFLFYGIYMKMAKGLLFRMLNKTA